MINLTDAELGKIARRKLGQNEALDNQIRAARAERDRRKAEAEPYVEPVRGTTLVQGRCKCGCETPVARGRLYRPGHDARHAGAVARALIANDSDRAASAARAAMSGALRAKVDKIRRGAK